MIAPDRPSKGRAFVFLSPRIRMPTVCALHARPAVEYASVRLAYARFGLPTHLSLHEHRFKYYLGHRMRRFGHVQRGRNSATTFVHLHLPHCAQCSARAHVFRSIRQATWVTYTLVVVAFVLVVALAEPQTNTSAGQISLALLLTIFPGLVAFFAVSEIVSQRVRQCPETMVTADRLVLTMDVPAPFAQQVAAEVWAQWPRPAPE